MTIKIDKPIVDYRVATGAQAEDEDSVAESADVIHMHENVDRPPVLQGYTYKIAKTPASEHAMYVTVNDIVLNPGTEHELRRPFEIFVNSKNMDHFQWIVALTRIMSAVFRKGGDVTFMVEELRSVFDPRGGYFKKGGRYMPSLVAELGDILEQHLKEIGLLEEREMDPHRKEHIKNVQAKLAQAKTATVGDSEFPNTATVCAKCYTKAVVRLDGCKTCLNCGDSDCG